MARIHQSLAFQLPRCSTAGSLAGSVDIRAQPAFSPAAVWICFSNASNSPRQRSPPSRDTAEPATECFASPWPDPVCARRLVLHRGQVAAAGDVEAGFVKRIAVLFIGSRGPRGHLRNLEPAPDAVLAGRLQLVAAVDGVFQPLARPRPGRAPDRLARPRAARRATIPFLEDGRESVECLFDIRPVRAGIRRVAFGRPAPTVSLGGSLGSLAASARSC